MPELSYCAQQVRLFDRDRFLCLLFAPPDRREALFALHAFEIELRNIPDRVSEHLLGKMRFQWWREALEKTYDGQPPAHGVVSPLAEAVRAYDLNRATLERLIDTRERDLEAWPIAGRGELDAYLDGTAAGLSDLTTAILGIDDGSREVARHAARAWALIRILRDIPIHAAGGRVFLPERACRNGRIRADDLLRGPSGRELTQLTAELAASAEADLRRTRDHGRRFPPRAMAAVLPAVLAGRLLRRLHRSCHDDPLHPALRRPMPLTAARLWYHARRGSI